jgi:hypothetical protein
MVVAALLTVLSIPAYACSGPTRVMFEVTASHAPVDTLTDLTLAQISEMADRTGRIGKHPPLGFYIGQLSYIVSAQHEADSQTGCFDRVVVTVTFILTDRHIELAKELLTRPCLFSVALDHYRRHAAADDAVLTGFTETLAATLQRIPLPPVGQDPALREEDRHKIKLAVKSAIDSGLDALGAARADARGAVDTMEEVRKLSEACTQGG